MNRNQRRQTDSANRRAPTPSVLNTKQVKTENAIKLNSTSLSAYRPAGSTLHVLGVPHTIPNEDYLVCAFTAKVMRFPEIIEPFGWNVIEYSNEGSASAAREHVVILTQAKLQSLSKRKSRECPHDADVNNKSIQEEFQRILIDKLRSRTKAGDIICHVWGPNIEVYDLFTNCHHVEKSVGYTASPGLPFRIYESSAWMHWHLGKAGREDGSHYQWVIPSGFDSSRWPCCEEPGDYALFLGRLTLRKGMNELVEIARRSPDLPIHAYGPGNNSQWANTAPPNLQFKGPIFGDERISVVQRACCMLMPTVFIEPFGFSGVEAQLCGVPLIASSFGAFQETVLDGVTGYRCHTLADWTEAIKLSKLLDRSQIAAIARSKYSMEVVGKQYDWVFRQIADLSDKGWYGDCSRKFPSVVSKHVAAQRKRRIWIYIPYFGFLPDYFQLYLESLANNAEFISVILLTDIDLSGYQLSENLIPLSMTLDELRSKIARFIGKQFDINVTPDALLKDPYKLCDFKILYPELFYDIGADHGVAHDDFVGWGDCDLIYGRFSDFLDTADNFHVIGGYHGHLTAIRNNASMRRLFSEVPDLPSLLLHARPQLVDESAFRGPLLDYLSRNQFRMFYINKHFCDIVPECFFEMFRPNHAHHKKNFFDAYHPDKNINHIYYKKDGRLELVYDDKTVRETIYCHLQKRKMTRHFENHENGFYIREDGFYLTPP